jgi:hypothetical protein
MRIRYLIAILLLGFGLQGCSVGDIFSSMMGGKNSDQADMNRTNEKNRVAQGINP